MINDNRIVPVTKTDLISLYATILLQASGNSGLAKLASLDVLGNYQVKTNSAVFIADQPVVSVDIDATASSVSACTVYFMADPNFKGFSIDGTAIEFADGSIDVIANGDLYKAVLASGDVTVTKVGL